MPRPKYSNESVDPIWEQWYPKLAIHEEGHGKLAKDIAHRIDKEILALEPKSSCEILKAEANGIGHRLTKELSKANKEYDRETDHGLTQGASILSYVSRTMKRATH
ncbi:DUF922 domain-containing protein [Pleionea sediminis]|uniref:DUF922 domain-containing protein n=1 Tax=Pleionea sediminis TaxID=2569479 RepID=UPI001185E5C0|nr:DUF922 domain-containing protein [Pleionea sediminis]